jgi:hypothetical protein
VALKVEVGSGGEWGSSMGAADFCGPWMCLDVLLLL